MASLDFGNSTITDMTNNVTDYSVDTKMTDGLSDQKETTWVNPRWSQQLGYFYEISELNRAITALAIWTVGKGFTTDNATEVLLGKIPGWGKEGFTEIMMNMVKTKKIGGGSFAEVIRNPKTGTLINLKTLDPSSIRTVVGRDGLIIRYEQISKTKTPDRKIPVEKMFHLVNDRIADQIHGTSIIDICEWVILARKEALVDHKKVLHRNVVPVRIIEVDFDDPVKVAKTKKQYEDVIEKGEVLIVPKGTIEIKDSNIQIQDPISWIRYLENFFYQAVGIPRIMATSEESTESGGKVGFLTFEPTYSVEQKILEDALWNQLAIKVKFTRPPRLGGNLDRDESKDTGQLGIQPSDTSIGEEE